jgi:hypothetical protein
MAFPSVIYYHWDQLKSITTTTTTTAAAAAAAITTKVQMSCG